MAEHKAQKHWRPSLESSWLPSSITNWMHAAGRVAKFNLQFALLTFLVFLCPPLFFLPWFLYTRERTQSRLGIPGLSLFQLGMLKVICMWPLIVQNAWHLFKSDYHGWASKVDYAFPIVGYCLFCACCICAYSFYSEHDLLALYAEQGADHPDISQDDVRRAKEQMNALTARDTQVNELLNAYVLPSQDKNPVDNNSPRGFHGQKALRWANVKQWLIKAHIVALGHVFLSWAMRPVDAEINNYTFSRYINQFATFNIVGQLAFVAIEIYNMHYLRLHCMENFIALSKRRSNTPGEKPEFDFWSTPSGLKLWDKLRRKVQEYDIVRFQSLQLVLFATAITTLFFAVSLIALRATKAWENFFAARAVADILCLVVFLAFNLGITLNVSGLQRKQVSVVDHQKFKVCMRFAEDMFRSQDRADERQRQCDAMHQALTELGLEVQRSTIWPSFLGVPITITFRNVFFFIVTGVFILLGGPKALSDGFWWFWGFPPKEAKAGGA